MINVEHYLYGKYVEGGRAWPEVDCYGIIMKLREDLGLKPWPIFDGVTKRENGLHKMGKQLIQNLTPCEPQEGAGVACYKGSCMVHVAMVVNTPTGLEVAECNPGTNVTFTPLRRFKRRYLRLEFYL
ncbi:nitrite transporter [Rheinheimera sp. MM224]|uniref:nitrite transporter n=1 Tax=Rheinheimera sp. MM224 TaxID=3019969 RepID=UPI0021F919E7|nr:nitrite transporter [Rheinheimera sp. MM224]CAI3796060.1 hypothetical protein JAMGFMIE_01473 [Rheinheimera sp. MM224]